MCPDLSEPTTNGKWLPRAHFERRPATLVPAEAQPAPTLRAYVAPSSAAGAGGRKAPDLALFEPLYSEASLRGHPRRRAAQGSLSEAKAAALKRGGGAGCASARAGLPTARSGRSFDRLRTIGAARARGAQTRNVRLNNAKVRPHATFACASSKRGVVSLLKPCCVPG